MEGLGLMGFWQGRRVLVTGHTGFKGAWACEMLLARGARVFGLALPPEAVSLFNQLGLAGRIDHAICDLREAGLVAARVAEVQPDFVLHLGAQSLVQRGYRQPVDTWATNVLGSIHLLAALSALGKRVVAVMVTTDKVYANRDWVHGYREGDELGGHDPYSASKAAMELAVDSWRRSFPGICLATARAGNVIGGGDWAENRILPDLARAFAAGQPLALRNPNATRPFQHVLEPLSGYLRLAERLATGDPRWQGAWNFGPEPADLRTVRQLVDAASALWPGEIIDASDASAPHEAGRLALTIDKARAELGWAPRWDITRGVAETVRWYRAVHDGAEPRALTVAQILAHEAGA